MMTETPSAETRNGLIDGDRTVPPSSNLRTVLAADLYAMVPELKEDIQLQPREGETVSFLLARLRSSTTPEEAVTMAAYAFQPRIAVWWAHECVTTMREHLTPVDHQLLELIGAWAHDPSDANRREIYDIALQAPSKTPGVWLGLATGASGGGRRDEPIDLSTPRAINAGVLSCLARGGLQQRSINLARFITLAQTLVGD
ncbi:hypothetical protein BCF46_3756 [Litoreibacter meonggei]|uniref:Uncharacterized protein n=2 Tax=Litoreibacter meonggei TaxID=1049199 RepID=A0A497V6F1_9RHOB|nr:hypothetical protein BCF46_3756 [Litoreibacter meonggei]